MKNKALISITFFILILFTSCQGQSETVNADENIPHFLRKENFTVFRLIILNAENQILMSNDQGHWGMPSVNLTKRQFLNEAIDSTASEHGIEIADIQLRGQFCFKYDYKPNVTFRNFYTARFKNGEIKIPTNTLESKFEKVEWVDIPNAIKRIENAGIQEITEHILNYPNVIWGGSFLVSHVGKDHPTVKVEDFYRLAELK